MTIFCIFSNIKCSVLFLLSEKIFCVLDDVHYLQMMKQQVYLLAENLDQIGTLNIGFVPVTLLFIDIYSS